MIRLRLPIRRFFQDTNKVEPAAARFGTVQWVLARSLYRFQLFDLSKLNQKNRIQALQLELKQWSPFVESGYFIGWRGGIAQVWCWDQAKVEQAIRQHQLKPDRLQVIPETLLRNAAQDETRLLRCREGYEGQAWKQGNLSDSRWWASLPTAEEWLQFQRDAGIPPEMQQHSVPVAETSQLNLQTWLTSGGGSQTAANQYERLAVACCLIPLVIFTLWYGINIYKLNEKISTYQAESARLGNQADPVLQARKQALDYLTRYKSLKAISPYPEQLRLMAEIAESLPNKTSLSEWDFESGVLKIGIVVVNDTASLALITSLRSSGFFGEVTSRPGNNPKVLNMQLDVLKDSK